MGYKPVAFNAAALSVAALAAWYSWGDGWFNYHPVFMIVGYVGLMMNAIHVERHSRQHMLHLYLMVASIACIVFAMYVIYSNKDMMKKPHFYEFSHPTISPSWHAVIGGFTACSHILQCLGSLGIMYPRPINGFVRKAHKSAGKLTFVGSVYALAGSDITSTWINGPDSQNTISGTSMASPHVAGQMAKYLSHNPTATPAEVTAALINAGTRNKIADAKTGSPNVLLFGECA